MEEIDEHGTALPPSAPEDGTAARAERVRQVVKALGGNRQAVRKTGVPLSTLGGYVAGGEMKLSNATALARAAGVRLEWLATGDGPMRAGEPPVPPTAGVPRGLAEAQISARSAEPGASIGLAWTVDPDRIARAYEMARAGLATPPGQVPDARRLMQVTLILYDHLTETEQASAKPSSPAP